MMPRKLRLSSEERIFNLKPFSTIRSSFNALQLKPTTKSIFPYSPAEANSASRQASAAACSTPAFPTAAPTLLTAAGWTSNRPSFLSRGRDRWNAGHFEPKMIACPESCAGGMRAGRIQTGAVGRDHGPCPKAVSELPFDTANFRIAVGYSVNPKCLPAWLKQVGVKSS